MGDTRAGNPLLLGDLGLALGFAVIEMPLPISGPPKEFDHPGCPGLPGWLGRSARLGGRVHDPVGGDAPFQGAHGPVLESSHGSQADLDRLFQKLSLGNGVVAAWGNVQDPEPDIRRALQPSSKPVAFGKPRNRAANPRGARG